MHLLKSTAPPPRSSTTVDSRAKSSAAMWGTRKSALVTKGSGMMFQSLYQRHS